MPALIKFLSDVVFKGENIDNNYNSYYWWESSQVWNEDGYDL